MRWAGVAKGMLVLGVVWWAWVDYAWLTSVVHPEEGAVRIAMFAAMAALLVVGLCVPKAFDELAVTFTIAYALVRLGHIALFALASRGDPGLRASVVALAASTLVAIALLGVASQVDGVTQGSCGRQPSQATWLARSSFVRKVGDSCPAISQSVIV